MSDDAIESFPPKLTTPEIAETTAWLRVPVALIHDHYMAGAPAPTC